VSSREEWAESRADVETSSQAFAAARNEFHAAEAKEDSAKRDYDANDSPTLLDRVQRATLARERAGRLLAARELELGAAVKAFEHAEKQLLRDRLEQVKSEALAAKNRLGPVARDLAKIDRKAFDLVMRAADLVADYESAYVESASLADKLGIVSYDLRPWTLDDARAASAKAATAERRNDNRVSIAAWLADEGDQ
jgi:hypothetical protein